MNPNRKEVKGGAFFKKEEEIEMRTFDKKKEEKIKAPSAEKKNTISMSFMKAVDRSLISVTVPEDATVKDIKDKLVEQGLEDCRLLRKGKSIPDTMSASELSREMTREDPDYVLVHSQRHTARPK